jgi:hypothetical protein
VNLSVVSSLDIHSEMHARCFTSSSSRSISMIHHLRCAIWRCCRRLTQSLFSLASPSFISIPRSTTFRAMAASIQVAGDMMTGPNTNRSVCMWQNCTCSQCTGGPRCCRWFLLSMHATVIYFMHRVSGISHTRSFTSTTIQDCLVSVQYDKGDLEELSLISARRFWPGPTDTRSKS